MRVQYCCIRSENCVYFAGFPFFFSFILREQSEKK